MLELMDADLRQRRALRCSLLSAASLLCLAVPQAPLWAQTYEEPPTAAPAAPPPADSVDAEDLTAPAKSPAYFMSTYRSNMYAPLPVKIWKQGGIPKVIQQSEQFANTHGRVGNYNKPGATITANNAFFQLTRHQRPHLRHLPQPAERDGPRALRNIQRASGNHHDPMFAPKDGANCPSAVPATTRPDSPYRHRGRGKKSLTGRLLDVADPGADPDRIPSRRSPTTQSR